MMPALDSPRLQTVNQPSISAATQLQTRRSCGFHIRRGTSLVEMVTAMSIASVMLLVAFRVLHTVLKAERTTSRAIWSSHSVNRLSRVFRSDVHAAGTIEISSPADDQPESLTLMMRDGGTIRYEVEQRGISRVAVQADKSEQRDRFRFPESTTCRFERRSAPDRVRLLLAVPRNPIELLKSSDSNAARSATPSDRLVPIEAIMARDRRFDAQRPEGRNTTP